MTTTVEKKVQHGSSTGQKLESALIRRVEGRLGEKIGILEDKLNFLIGQFGSAREFSEGHINNSSSDGGAEKATEVEPVVE